MLHNLAAVGGNLVRKQPWSDVIPHFRGFGASIALFDVDDLRATAAYRTRLVSVGVTRCLEQAKRRLEGVTS